MTDKNKNINEIAGCSFSIYPMCDQFVDLILSALETTDTSKVWMNTDEVSTIVRGRIPHIFDVTTTAFLKTAKSGEHVVFSGTFSIGCPSDTEGHTYMAEDDIRMNAEMLDDIEQGVVAKFALYPMGGGDYVDVIYNQIDAMRDHGLDVLLTHYETKLEGSAQDVFKGLEKVFAKTDEAGSSHTVMTATIVANSPSFEE